MVIWTRVGFFSRVVLCNLLLWVSVDGQCNIPLEYSGEWYSLERDRDINTVITQQSFGDLECLQIQTYPNSGAQQGVGLTMLMSQQGHDTCYRCVDVLWRTPNVLQYRKGDCIQPNSLYQYGIEHACPSVRQGLPILDRSVTLFKRNPTPVDCESTWEYEAIFQFRYETAVGGGGVCNNSDNTLRTCERKGDSYKGNSEFLMNFAACPGQSSLTKNVYYTCLGSWSTSLHGTEMTYAAIADPREPDIGERFKCLIDLQIRPSNQYNMDNIRWGMSHFADCSSINSVYDVYMRLGLTPDREESERICK